MIIITIYVVLFAVIGIYCLKYDLQKFSLYSCSCSLYKQIQENKEIEIPTKKSLLNNPIFFNKLKEYLIQHIHESNIRTNLEDPEFINGITNALIRYQMNIKKHKKQDDLLKKLIENLQKKK